MALNKVRKYVISRQSFAFYLTLLRIDYKGRKLQKIDITIANTYFLSNFFSYSIILLITYLNPNRFIWLYISNDLFQWDVNSLIITVVLQMLINQT